MASIVLGTATHVGIDGLTVTWSGFAANKNVPQKAGRRDSINAIPFRNADGDTVGMSLTDAHDMIEFEGVIKGTTRADAKSVAKLPDPGTAVTLDNFLATEINGTWTYAGDGFISFDNSGDHAKVTMTLHRYKTGAALATVSNT